MKKRLLFTIGALLFIALALFIWRLDIPNWKKLDMTKLTQMPGTTVVYDLEDVPVGALHGDINRVWIPIEEIPVHVQQAFIAAEDLRFYRHHGVDLYRLIGALWQDIRTLSYAQGASTITQQLIKLTHLSQTKTLSRKAQEIVLAMQLERVMDKEQILEAYLNAVYFGHGAYGVEAAANTYFAKTASELTLAEGALLAGVIKAPSSYAPHLNAKKAISRRNVVLETMEENGMITAEEAVTARNEPLQLATGQANAGLYTWYMDAVLDEAMNVLGLSADEIVTGAFHIHTGLNTSMQQVLDEMFEDASNFPEGAPDGTPVQAALVSLDTGNGQLRAMAGGRSYDVMRGLNRATQIYRQPGSAFKPLSTYAAAIDAFGYVPSSIVDDTPRIFAGGYAPGNAGGKSYGPVTMREALFRSLNIATVALADEIGVSALRTYALRFGLPLSPEDCNLSLALGSLTYGVSPAQLGAAYCTLANGGMQVKAHTIRAIVDSDGNTVYRAESSQVRAVQAETAYMITDMLKTAATIGSAQALSACQLTVAGKTGTVSDGKNGTRDIWTAAYTPQVAVVAWMGYDDPSAAHTLPASSGGGGYPARLCAAFLNGVSAQMDQHDFVRPDGVRIALLDGLALEKQKSTLLSTEKTPAEYTTAELFHEYDMPERFSGNWEAPKAVQDLRLLSAPGEMPVIAFTAQEDDTEYAVMRTVNGKSAEIAALQGSAGLELRFADETHDLAQEATYALLPRNARLYERGELLTGPQSASIRYTPGGLLNRIMGVGADVAPTPAEIEFDPDQSLFN